MMNETAKQRAALCVLELIASSRITFKHTWTEEQVAEVKIEIAKIEMGLRRIAVGTDARACKGLARETGRQVKMRHVKGVK